MSRGVKVKSPPPNLVPIGQMAIFYLPVQKLHLVCNGTTLREIVQTFLMEHYNAFTVQTSDNQGYWRESRNDPVFHDVNMRYEVSFEGEDLVRRLVQFLAHLCSLMDERAIYLTMGYRSYLVRPERSQSEIPG